MTSPVSSPAHPRDAWRAWIYPRFNGQPHPLSLFADGIIPAASVWTGMRRWTQAFRAMGLQPGDRVVVALPPSAAFLQVLLASLWEGLTVALASPRADAEDVLTLVDARCAIALSAGAHTVVPEGSAGPRTEPIAVRTMQHAPEPDVRFLLHTSGTTKAPRWVALSDANVMSVLHSHEPALALDEQARLLSVLPWHHAFGLVIELLPALRAGTEIIRAPNHGRDPRELLQLIEAHAITHLSAVPLTLQRLLDLPGGREAVQGLQGGVVGGAAVSASLAEQLQQTRLRVGYGQTEAGPGLMLGAPGAWQANYIGHPTGCRVQVDGEGQLLFQGPNACVGLWTEGGFEPLAPDRWVPTGDLVEERPTGYVYRGRTDAQFKLSNGRMVQAGRWEAELKEHLPELEDALLLTLDGEVLHLMVRLQPEAAPLDPERVRTLLGPLGPRLHTVHHYPDERWIRTRKGAVHRSGMISAMPI